MATKYPPYVNGYGNLSALFLEIRKASVPPKFTQDFLHTKLGLKSSTFRAMVPLLKKLGFLDQGNVPTEAYKKYRGSINNAKAVMMQQIKQSYSDLYASAEYAHKLKKEELVEKLRTLTGAGLDDKVIPAVAGTFMELCKLADFEGKPIEEKDEKAEKGKEIPATGEGAEKGTHKTKLGISYTINLNLPATTEIEVFNAIFKSLKEHIINED